MWTLDKYKGLQTRETHTNEKYAKTFTSSMHTTFFKEYLLQNFSLRVRYIVDNESSVKFLASIMVKRSDGV